MIFLTFNVAYFADKIVAIMNKPKTIEIFKLLLS